MGFPTCSDSESYYQLLPMELWVEGHTFHSPTYVEAMMVGTLPSLSNHGGQLQEKLSRSMMSPRAVWGLDRTHLYYGSMHHDNIGWVWPPRVFTPSTYRLFFPLRPVCQRAHTHTHTHTHTRSASSKSEGCRLSTSLLRGVCCCYTGMSRMSKMA